jgi:protein involved in polysaccharide export with SLBB domain
LDNSGLNRHSEFVLRSFPSTFVSLCLGGKPVVRSWFGVLLCCVLLALAGRAAAQQSQPGSTAPLYQTSVFKYYVWGQVSRPGAYGLSASADLMELISAAGGPTEYADISHVVVFRAVTQKRVKVNLPKTLAAGQIVELSPGDVVMVPDSPWYKLQYGLGVVNTVVSFATLAMTIIIATGAGK